MVPADCQRIEIPPDPFDEFFALPVGIACTDPRFDIRRLHPGEFERAYECVDAAFGRKRPRAVFDWLYRENPYGRARVWVVEERSTGRILKSSTAFPWPVWRGTEALRGAMGGDSATVPDWQRGGLSHILRPVRRSHPWQGTICSISGPNANSRFITKKRGEGEKILGRLRGGIAVLQAPSTGARSGVAAALTGAAARAASGSLAAWRALALGGSAPANIRFGTLDRFDPAFDALTLRTMGFPEYWSPHNSRFLNWRYLDHPAESYSAFAVRDGDRVVGYAVLRFAGDRAMISEFAVESKPAGHARTLLAGLIDVAKQAGCAYLHFFGTPVWRHWGLFRRAGMVPYPTNNYFEVSYDLGPAECRDIRNWQITPGDRDYH